MNRTRVFALAAMMAVGIAAPASADWDRLGTVNISGRETARVYGSFGGPVERLYFDADRSDVYCRSIRVTFANGRVRNVFSGRLSDRNPRIVDLPGYQRSVRRIDLRCRALQRRSAQIQISADIGSYRETWRRNPNFERLWGAVFNWDNDRNDRNDRDGRRDRDGRNDRNDRDNDQWVRLGSERFDGRETETTFAGFRGRGLEAIGIQAVDDDARCRSVRVHFANGGSRNVSFGERMDEDRIYRVDLPGDERNVTRVDLDCRPVGDDDVTLNIYGIS
jgi:hypothetical protein